MVRILSVASLALAVVSAVSGHVIRHRSPPKGWETAILESYDVYHARYIDFKCYEKHNTTYFNECCHPLLEGESISVLHDRQCFSTADDGNDCDDGNSSIPPSTPTSYSPAVTTSSPSPEHNTPTSSPPVYSPEPSTSTSSSPVYTTSPAAQPKVAKPESPETSSAPATTHAEAPAPAPSPSPPPPPPSPSPSPSPSSSPTNTGNGGGDFQFGGFATFFFQNGNPGACGQVHSDNDLIAAMDQARYGNSGGASELCGKQVEIINLANGQSVVVTVADDCPTCDNANSIDLSTGAFKHIGDESTGQLSIKWRFL